MRVSIAPRTQRAWPGYRSFWPSPGCEAQRFRPGVCCRAAVGQRHRMINHVRTRTCAKECDSDTHMPPVPPTATAPCVSIFVFIPKTAVHLQHYNQHSVRGTCYLVLSSDASRYRSSLALRASMMSCCSSTFFSSPCPRQHHEFATRTIIARLASEATHKQTYAWEQKRAP